MNERLKELRKTLNLSGEKFGKPIGISKYTISKFENGINNLSEITIKSICKQYNVNEEWFRTGNGEMFIDRSREEQIMKFVADIYREDDQFKLDFISTISQLTEEEWKLLNSICVKLAAIEKKES